MLARDQNALVYNGRDLSLSIRWHQVQKCFTMQPSLKTIEYSANDG